MTIRPQKNSKQQTSCLLPISVPFVIARRQDEILPLVRDMRIDLPDDFELNGSKPLTRPFLQVRMHGNPSHPIVVVLGGISANRIVVTSKDQSGWWHKMAGPGRVVDTNKFCVLSFDLLPNDPCKEQPISTMDQAKALAHIVDVLGIKSIHAFIGASYGGMVALSFAANFGHLLQRLIVLCAAHRPHPAATALRGIQRRIIKFGLQNGDGPGAVALARQLAMTTYRTSEEFASRFPADNKQATEDNTNVCKYLIAQGQAFTMPGERYLSLSQSIDRHFVNPAQIQTQCTLIGFTSDRVVPIADMRELANSLPNAGLIEIPSLYGHDGFLKETSAIGPYIKPLLTRSVS